MFTFKTMDVLSFFSRLLCCTVYFQLLNLDSIPKRTDPVEMIAIEQCFPVVLFITLHKVVLTFVSEDEILKCDHSNESH